MAKRRWTKGELIEAGARLQREARRGKFARGKLCGDLWDEALGMRLPFGTADVYQHRLYIAAQLAAEKAGLA